jgi:Zn-dependent protease with chaperone function/uncharacterized tellurite resistance protein B-like protein
VRGSLKMDKRVAVNLDAIDFHSVSFNRERELSSSLLASAAVLEKFEEIASVSRRNIEPLLVRLYSEGLLINEARAPEINSALKRAQEFLKIQADVKAFVCRFDQSLASVLREDEDSYILLLNPELLERCSIEELRFIIGHELGHVALGHFDLRSIEIDGLPSRLINQYFEYSRLCEISADRAGLLCCGSFEAAYSALRLAASGTNSKFLQTAFNSNMFQLEKLKELLQDKQNLLESKRSHPCGVVRLGALQLLEQRLGGLNSKAPRSLREIEPAILEMINIMTPKATNEEEWLKTVGAFWVAYADEDFQIQQRKEVARICSSTEFNDLHKICKENEDPAFVFRQMFVSSFSELKMSLVKRASLIEQLVAIARADGGIVGAEIEVLTDICEIIDLDKSFLLTIVR